MKKEYITNRSIKGSDIKQIRKRLNMTQKEFAEFVCCSKRTVETWEAKQDEITGPIVTLIELLFRDPEIPQRLELPPKKYKMRLLYLYNDYICTVIDVDEAERKVEVTNYKKNPLFRAFGVNTEPEYEDYEEFLESRCFPRKRDKIKLELKRLDIPFYDPILIISKTEGRVEGDNFSLKIVK